MPAINSGSIRQTIYDTISPMPSAVSGGLFSSVDNAIFFVENYTGDTIGTSSIAEQYQPAIQNMATANILKLLAVQDLGTNFVSVGDLSTNNDNLNLMAKQFEEMAIMQLKSLSKSIKVYKVRG